MLSLVNHTFQVTIIMFLFISLSKFNDPDFVHLFLI